MEANGTAADPVVIRGLNRTPGYWNGIELDHTNSAGFTHTVVTDFGSTEPLSPLGAAFNLLESFLILDNVTISNGIGDGIKCDNPSIFDDGSFIRFISNVQITGITGVMVEPECNNF